MESLENKNSTERVLEAKELEKLIFLSFMHSQGYPSLQQMLCNWIGNYYGPQDPEMFESAQDSFMTKRFKEPDDMLDIAEKSLHTQVITGEGNYGETVRSKINKETAESQLHFVQAILSGGALHEYTISYMEQFLKGLLDRDTHYLTYGRPNRDDDAENRSIAGKYFSSVKKYLIDADTTSDPALDALYKQFRPLFFQMREEEAREYLDWKDKYELRHDAQDI